MTFLGRAATGSKNFGRTRDLCHADAGYTLLELLVTLTIFALAATVGTATLRDGWRTPSLRPYAVGLASEIKAARAAAIISNKPIGFALDGAQRTYRIGNRSPVRIPSGIDLALQVPPGTQGRLEFYADGSSNGGRLTVSMGGSSILLDVEWLTGSVRVR